MWELLVFGLAGFLEGAARSFSKALPDGRGSLLYTRPARYVSSIAAGGGNGQGGSSEVFTNNARPFAAAPVSFCPEIGYVCLTAGCYRSVAFSAGAELARDRRIAFCIGHDMSCPYGL